MPGRILTDAERTALDPTAFAARAMAKQFEDMKASKTVVTFGLLATIIEPLVDALGKNFKAQAARIEALETRPMMNYRGVWNPDDDYRPGDLVTHGGSMHYCWAAVRGIRPGETDAWQLCVKRGADAR